MNKKTKLAIILVFAAIGMAVLNPLVSVEPGERGVLTKFGKVQDEILGEGLHVIMPIVNDVHPMSVRIAKVATSVQASSKDLQTVNSKVEVTYTLDPLNVNKIYQTLRYGYESRVIAPAIQEQVKAGTAQYTAEELITKRAEVKEAIETALKANLYENNILVDQIYITDFDFSDTFNAAIESKEEAKQLAIKARNDLERVKMEAEQKVATARAEAEAIKIKAQAVTQKGGKDYVQLQAIEKWDGVLPASMIPGGTVPFINLNGSR